MTPVPALHPTVAEAASRLAAASEPFLFFRDAETGGDNAAYPRYNGQLGLIAPPAAYQHRRRDTRLL